jgi:uncharacterized Ntn-hydrolase superfamily protein
VLVLPVMFVARPATATWSVIALDQRTGTVVIASASCVAGEALTRFGGSNPNGLMGIQAIVVPGVGVAAAQAGVDQTHENQMLIYRELRKGTPPSDIILLLKADPRIETRQFGIVDMQGRMAGFSGERNGAASLHEFGQVEDQPVFFSIQGNILTSASVVHAAASAFRNTRGSLTDRVMNAMEVADAEGGDSRCSCDNPRNPPVAATVCTNKTAHVAYILRADKNDPSGESHNDGKYAFFLSVTDQNITAGEDANPVKTLRMRYDAAMTSGGKPPTDWRR